MLVCMFDFLEAPPLPSSFSSIVLCMCNVLVFPGVLCSVFYQVRWVWALYFVTF